MNSPYDIIICITVQVLENVLNLIDLATCERWILFATNYQTIQNISKKAITKKKLAMSAFPLNCSFNRILLKLRSDTHKNLYSPETFAEFHDGAIFRLVDMLAWGLINYRCSEIVFFNVLSVNDTFFFSIFQDLTNLCTLREIHVILRYISSKYHSHTKIVESLLSKSNILHILRMLSKRLTFKFHAETKGKLTLLMSELLSIREYYCMNSHMACNYSDVIKPETSSNQHNIRYTMTDKPRILSNPYVHNELREDKYWRLRNIQKIFYRKSKSFNITPTKSILNDSVTPYDNLLVKTRCPNYDSVTLTEILTEMETVLLEFHKQPILESHELDANIAHSVSFLTRRFLFRKRIGGMDFRRKILVQFHIFLQYIEKVSENIVLVKRISRRDIQSNTRKYLKNQKDKLRAIVTRRLIELDPMLEKITTKILSQEPFCMNSNSKETDRKKEVERKKEKSSIAKHDFVTLERNVKKNRKRFPLLKFGLESVSRHGNILQRLSYVPSLNMNQDMLWKTIKIPSFCFSFEANQSLLHSSLEPQADGIEKIKIDIDIDITKSNFLIWRLLRSICRRHYYTLHGPRERFMSYLVMKYTSNLNKLNKIRSYKMNHETGITLVNF